MPPKPKCSREDIVNAAYDIMCDNGVDAISAREVGKKLGTTTAPIFTFFEGMNELKEAVYAKAYEECSTYLGESLNHEMAYKEFGSRWIKYAYEKPNIYSMIFVKNHPRKRGDGFLNEDFDEMLLCMRKEVMKKYELSDSDAKMLIDNMCVYAQGVATFLVNGQIAYDEEKINKSLSKMCVSLVAGCKIADGTLDMDLFKKRLS